MILISGVLLYVLGFSCKGSAEREYPSLGKTDEKLLLRFLELYGSRENLLERLIHEAKGKLVFSEESVRFWAPRLVDGRLGPLDPLISEDLEEIMVNGIGLPIFVYDRSKGMQETNLSITSPEYFMGIANRMLAPLGRRVNSSNPRETGVVDSGDRISVVIPPYSKTYALSVRKYAVEPFTIPDLIEKGMLKGEDAALLWLVMEAGLSFGVVGNTGSGKTTLLNALLRFIPQKNRMILVEDIPEIQPLQNQFVRLLSNKSLGLYMRDAILDSLRLRPDKVVIGEVRTDEEVNALKESCLAGHAMGTYFTYHAESSDWAYRRLVNQGFPEYDLGSIPLLVSCRRYERSGRLMRKVVEIGGRSTAFGKAGSKKSIIPELKSVFDNPGREIKNRAAFLESCTGLRDKAFFARLQGWQNDL